jgi:hypothetical protein
VHSTVHLAFCELSRLCESASNHKNTLAMREMHLFYLLRNDTVNLTNPQNFTYTYHIIHLNTTAINRINTSN